MRMRTTGRSNTRSITSRRWNEKERQSFVDRRKNNAATPLRAIAEPGTEGYVENETEITFPFVKIVDQEELKLCLIMNVIDPAIGGVLIMGDRGTA